MVEALRGHVGDAYLEGDVVDAPGDAGIHQHRHDRHGADHGRPVQSHDVAAQLTEGQLPGEERLRPGMAVGGELHRVDPAQMTTAHGGDGHRARCRRELPGAHGAEREDQLISASGRRR